MRFSLNRKKSNRLRRKSNRKRLRFEAMEPRILMAADLFGAEEADQVFTGSRHRDVFRVGSGRQFVDAGRGNDTILAYGDAGEPDPAQTDGSDGRVNPAIPLEQAADIYIGGDGADTFQFSPLLNANEEILDQYRNQSRSQVNWRRVAGENDGVHEHWVEGVGTDIVLDYDKEEGDQIKLVGHTVSVASIDYGEDENGTFSKIKLKSNQGGAGAHDGDDLGTLYIYGDKVEKGDLKIDAGVFYGMERLNEANRLAEDNGGARRTIVSATNGDSFTGGGRVHDIVTLGEGSQTIDAQSGNDRFLVYGDAGEPDPAQTEGSEGRVNDPVDPADAVDILRGGLGKDRFEFRALLNAKEEILEKHTRSNGTVNWRRVAGENNNVHDHWVQGIGNDKILDYDEGDGDQIRLLGHTLTVESIEYGEDALGAFSLITLVSDQGGAGAHDGDPLGTLQVYGDKVTEDDLFVKANVFYGVDRLVDVEDADNSEDRDEGIYGSPSEHLKDPAPMPDSEQVFVGYRWRDRFRVGSGRQLVDGGAGNDHFISYGDAGEPDPAQTDGSDGRVNKPIAPGLSNDVFIGGPGADTFQFSPLLNAQEEVLDQYRNQTSGRINWARVAGENDGVHEHWVEGVGDDMVLDYNEEEGDKIKLIGHTVSIADIEYGEDDAGAFSVLVLESNQGGAGAHDGDPLGTVTIYGDKVTRDDVSIDAKSVYGIERLYEADRMNEDNGGGRREIVSSTHGDSFTGGTRVSDIVTLGSGAQKVDTQAGNDRFLLLGDAGEPDPAQTDGADGRVNDPVDPELANDIVRGGIGKDRFEFRALLNAKEEILEKHTRSNGTINWRRVAGENGGVHEHWVEGVGDDIVLDYDEGDGDQIRLLGHTLTVASIDYGEDALGAYSHITLVSDQGGAGAHDGDPLGSVRVYGDKVTEDDLVVKANVFYGVDMLERVAAADNSLDRQAGVFGTPQEMDNAIERGQSDSDDDGCVICDGIGRDRFITLAAEGRFDMPSDDDGLSEGAIYAQKVDDLLAEPDDFILTQVWSRLKD